MAATVTLELVDKLPRRCGDCQLCCKLLPVQEIGKLAGVKCRHQAFSVGCRVYGGSMPSSCKLWSCAWLTGAFVGGSRPDRSHYVVDILPDFITAVDASGAKVTVPVVQVWCDPHWPDAHRDVALRAYLEERGQNGVAALVRYGAAEAIVLIPPAMGGGSWIETERKPAAEKQHTFAQMAQALGRPNPAST